MTIEDRLAQGKTVSGPQVLNLFNEPQHIFVYRTALAFLRADDIEAAKLILEDALETSQ